MDKYMYTHPSGPMDDTQLIIGLVIIGMIVTFTVVCASWPSIVAWFNGIRYRNNTIKSFIICQKSPDIDLKKIYQIVDNTNDFLRGKTLKGVKTNRKKIKTKNLISITSIPGERCYYFIIWYKSRG